jgi:3-oxoacyl-[acyl-carrier-protein] synthase I
MIDQVGDPMPGALDAQLDPVMMGSERLLALAETALREACALPTSDARAPRLRLPVYLGLPEYRPGFTKQDAEEVQHGLTKFEALPIEISEVNVSVGGHAAGLSALATATEQIGHPFNAGRPAPSITCCEGLTTLPGHGQRVDL